MKFRHYLTTIIISIFLLGIFSIYQEINQVHRHIQSLDRTVSISLETAVQSAMASEEFFYNYDSNPDVLSWNENYSTLATLDSSGNWFEGNLYAMAMAYDTNGRLPRNPSELGDQNIDSIYSWLYGNVGTRTPNSEFRAFYNNVGSLMEGRAFIVSSGSFHEETIPVLAQMGLRLDSDLNSSANNYNENLVNVQKRGRGGNPYYLTPASLGVTYLDTRVLEAVSVSHMEQLMRYQRGSTPEYWRRASGPLPVSVYSGSDTPQYVDLNFDQLGSNDGRSNLYMSEEGVNSSVVNNGAFHIDLNSIKVEVDYAMIDIYDSANADIVNKALGAVPYDTSLSGRPAQLLANDNTAERNGDRIVARVSMEVDVFIPYFSPLMQWVRHTNRTGITGETYGLRKVNPDGTLGEPNEPVSYYHEVYVIVNR